MSKQIYIVEQGDLPRLDIFLAQAAECTRSYIKQLNDKGRILLNGNKVKCGKSVKSGDVIEIEYIIENTEVLPQNLPLDIIYEDSDILVVNKAQGMVVHPAVGNYEGTLVNALMYHIKDLSGINGVIRPGIVHRLDKDTSGVMVVAKSDAAHLSLSRQIAERTVKKSYIALVDGSIKTDNGHIETLISRDTRDRKKMCVSNSEGRIAITYYKVLKRYSINTLCMFNIVTGRTHQIRVHSRYIGYPIVGDKTYGAKRQRFNLNGQLLHSYSLEFNHPISGERLTFKAKLPNYFTKVLKNIKKEGKLCD